MRPATEISKKGWLLAVPLIFTTMVGSGQSTRFSQFYDIHQGADVLLDVELLQNGQVAVAGTSLNLTDNSGSYDGVHLLVDGNGQVLQENRYSEVNVNFNTRAVIQSSYSDAVYSTGYYCDFNVESPGHCDFYFARLDEGLDTVFVKVISRPDTSDLLLSMVETKPNRIMLIGWTYNDTTDADADILLITVDTLGNEVNRVVYGGGGTDYIHSGIVINEVGEVIMTGFTKSFGGSANGRTWTIKTDSIGNVLWHEVYSGDANNGTGIGICRSSDGNLVISGGNNGTGNGSDGMLLKIDTEGNEIWTKRYEVPNGQGLWGVVGLEDGTIVSCGVTDDGDNQAGWLIKTDENGDTLWTQTYDPSDATDYLRNMLVMPNGDIVMVGFGRGENSTTQDGWILRVDSMGCLVEDCHLVGVEESSAHENSFTVYPNPVNDLLNIETKQGRVKQVDLYNGLGALVYSETGTAQQKRIDMSGFGRGVYLLMVETDNGMSSTKLVLE